MNRSRTGMTLFELLIVMIIVGVVYSIGIFTIKKEKVLDTPLSLSTLKTTLSSLSQSDKIRLLCDARCQECRIFNSENKLVTTAHLQSQGSIERYGFDRYGELQNLGKIVAKDEEKLVQGCFEMTLSPDGSSTPLILKNDQTFYAYTPLEENKPYITQSEEALRQHLFKETLYPLRGDDTYGE